MLFFKKKPAHTITILPHPQVCPSGEIVPAVPGKSIVENLLDNDVEISHSCQMQCACLTCHIYIIEGEQWVSNMQDDENTELTKAQDRQHWSRLGCQAAFNGGGNLVIEIRN
jgi:2Fe-2S ferredoxin